LPVFLPVFASFLPDFASFLPVFARKGKVRKSLIL